MMARANHILQAIDRAQAMGARSPISVWMRENYDGFAARLAGRRADWRVLAQVFADAGLTDNPASLRPPRRFARRGSASFGRARGRRSGWCPARPRCLDNAGGQARRLSACRRQASLTMAMILPPKHTFTTAQIRK